MFVADEFVTKINRGLCRNGAFPYDGNRSSIVAELDYISTIPETDFINFLKNPLWKHTIHYDALWYVIGTPVSFPDPKKDGFADYSGISYFCLKYITNLPTLMVKYNHKYSDICIENVDGMMLVKLFEIDRCKKILATRALLSKSVKMRTFGAKNCSVSELTNLLETENSKSVINIIVKRLGIQNIPMELISNNNKFLSIKINAALCGNDTPTLVKYLSILQSNEKTDHKTAEIILKILQTLSDNDLKYHFDLATLRPDISEYFETRLNLIK